VPVAPAPPRSSHAIPSVAEGHPDLWTVVPVHDVSLLSDADAVTRAVEERWYCKCNTVCRRTFWVTVTAKVSVMVWTWRW
jgi:hypothetical protein